MAGYNEILEGRFNRGLQRLLSMKGAAVMNELGTVLTPSISVHADADVRFLESWDSFGFIAAGLANATTGSGVRVRNPATSGVIAVFTRVELGNAVTTVGDTVVLEIGATAVDLAGANGIGRALDTRTLRNSALIVSINPAAGTPGLGTGVAQYAFTAGAAVVETRRDFLDGFQRIVLSPGFAFQLRNSAVNQGININLLWEERTLGENERT